MSRESRNESLRELMDRRGVEALLLNRPANFAWYTGGADNRVDRGDPAGVASILLTQDDVYVLPNNIEAPRMRDEQTPEMEIAEHPWHGGPAGLLGELAGGVGSDMPDGPGPDLSADVAPLRYILDDAATEAYRRLGSDTSHAMAEVAGSLTPETDELEAATRLSPGTLHSKAPRPKGPSCSVPTDPRY